MQLEQPAKSNCPHLAQYFPGHCELLAGSTPISCPLPVRAAGRFSSFYELCPILALKQPDRKTPSASGRMTATQPAQAFTLLASTLERMKQNRPKGTQSRPPRARQPQANPVPA